MSRTKTAALTSSLVAIKGGAAPAPDMPPRGAAPKAAPKRADKAAAAPKESADLNFKVSADFKREFRTYAATHDLKLNALLVAAFQAYKKANP